jgi:hypothetical protein
MDDDRLMAACVNLENALTFSKHEDIDGNKIREQKPNGQRKTQVPTTESHRIQQSPGMNHPVEFASEAF